MTLDFFEIDFLDVGDTSSGDAITIRIVENGVQSVAVVDGGYSDCGEKIINHIKQYYGGATSIQHMVLTHPDGDHAAGLKKVLEEFTVERLWMNRPWLYVDTLINYFPTYNDPARLVARLKKAYPNIRDLEAIADERGVLIEEAFQGAMIGAFRVMSPTYAKFIELVLRDDDKADEFTEAISESLEKSWFFEVLQKAIKFVASAWGEENLPRKETSPRNEMSIIQYGEVCGKRVLLTGDAGPEALEAFIDYAPSIGLMLPGIDRFQVPHHGSRRNVSSDLLDAILGEKKASKGTYSDFTAVISAGENDSHHPKKAVVRALMHRGAFVGTTEGKSIRMGHDAPDREGWSATSPYDYPTDQEE